MNSYIHKDLIILDVIYVHRKGSNNIRFYLCKLSPSIELRYMCKNCKIDVCNFCSIKTNKNQ